MMYFDPTYLILVALPAMILSGLAQWYVRSNYSKWGQVKNSRSLTGADVAQGLIQKYGLNVNIAQAEGELADHFDPSSGVVRLSPGVASQPSIASMAIAAHEFGHVQQHKDRSPLMAMRSFLVPAVQISPTVSYMMIIGGLLLNFSGLAWLGVGLFGISVVFMLLTLPVEIDASTRAMKMLNEGGYFASEQDRQGARQMLTAAALTYIAAAITSILTLLYYVSLVSRSSRRSSY
jgi:uncharacterized protein